MIVNCDRCGAAEGVIVRNKRKEVKVFCKECGKLLRFATKEDKHILRTVKEGRSQ